MPIDEDIDFRALFFRSSAPCVVIDRQYIIILANDAYVMVSGVPRQSLLGRNIFDVFPDDPADATATGVANLRRSLDCVLRTAAEDRMAIQKYSTERPASRGGGFEARYWQPVNTPLPGRDGAVRYIIHHVEEVTQSVIDATAELQAAHRQLQYQMAQLDAVITSAPEAIYVGTANGITRCNEHALAQLGFDTVEELNQNIGRLSEIVQNRDPATGELVPPQELPFVRALAGERAVRDTEVVHLKTGEKRLIRGAASPVKIDNTIVGAVAINTDVTEERSRERALRAAHETMEEALLTANVERQARERLVASLSHDLRTPMSVAKVSAELLRLKADDPAVVRQIAERIADNMDRADRMICELLDNERGIVEGRFALCNLTEIATQVLNELSLIHGSRFVLEGEQRVIGHWSSSGLQRVLENLCSNAAKYSAPGSPVTVRIEAGERQATIRVHNEGDPIPEDLRSGLFVPYWRAGASRATSHAGWGIGLSLVRGIVESHGGSVSVESSTVSGTTFCLVLPCKANGPEHDRATLEA